VAVIAEAIVGPGPQVGAEDQEAAVQRPRIRIAWAMVFTAIAALDLAAIRAVLDRGWGPESNLLAVGALPMANVLAFGLLVGGLHRGSRPFLVGFEVIGTLALAFYITAILSPPYRESVPQMIVIGYLWLAWDLWPTGAARTIPRVLIAYSALSLWVTWPQLALAVAGGFFTRLPAPLRGKPSPGGRGGD
jgi:hypothetical protein